MKTSQEYEPLSSVSMSGMFGWMVYVFTAQWNREHDLAVAQYQVSVEAFDDLQGDQSFEAHLYTQLDRQLLEMACTAPWSPDSLKKDIKKPEELDIKDSMIYVKANPSRQAAIKEIVGPMSAPMVIGKQEKNNFVSAVDLKDFVIHEVKNLEGDIFVEGKVVRVRTWGA